MISYAYAAFAYILTHSPFAVSHCDFRRERDIKRQTKCN